MLGRLVRLIHKLADRVDRLRWESPQGLAGRSQQYWNDPSRPGHYFHQRGDGPFANDSIWLQLGHTHRLLYERAAEWTVLPSTLDRIIEWGCGGGMNAVQFAPITREYCGIDINPGVLEECKRQLAESGFQEFVPILIEAGRPETAKTLSPGPCELFLCTYVFEVFPTPEYGLKVLEVAFDMLQPGGIALVHVRYNTGKWHERSPRRNYDENVIHMTTYAIDELWSAVEQIGFRPLFVHLIPDQPELRETRYAYYAIQKPGEQLSASSDHDSAERPDFIDNETGEKRTAATRDEAR